MRFAALLDTIGFPAGRRLRGQIPTESGPFPYDSKWGGTYAGAHVHRKFSEVKPMMLEPKPNYPSTRSYVLKLHRAAAPERGHIVGRIENMASGRYFSFRSAEELIACLTQDLALSVAEEPKS